MFFFIKNKRLKKEIAQYTGDVKKQYLNRWGKTNLLKTITLYKDKNTNCVLSYRKKLGN